MIQPEDRDKHGIDPALLYDGFADYPDWGGVNAAAFEEAKRRARARRRRNTLITNWLMGAAVLFWACVAGWWLTHRPTCETAGISALAGPLGRSAK